MIFDTGSPYLWLVSGQQCKSTLKPNGDGYNCMANQRYNHNVSSSYVADGSKYLAAYGAGKVKGFFSRDLLTLSDSSSGNAISLNNAPLVEGTKFKVRIA